MIHRFLPAGTLVLMLLVGGCATPDVRPVPVDPQAAWEQRLQTLGNLNQWDLQARIAVRAGDDGGQANLHWNHRDDDNDMRLVGAWGKGLLRLNFNPDSAELTDDLGQTRSGADAGELLYEATGWIIPVSSLNAWMAGRPLGTEAITRIDKYGRLAHITESGWEIEYQEYRQFDGWELPRKLKLSQMHSTNGEQRVSVRLVVNSWQVGS